MTFRSPQHLALVRQVPCVNCGTHGVQAAHSNLLRHGKGRSLKASDAAAAALCPDCHADLDQGATLSADEREALTHRWIADTYIALVERGLLVPARR